MKIGPIRSEYAAGRARVVAPVEWEDTDRARLELFFETDAADGGTLIESPDAFLVGAVLPAWRHGERRIRVDGKVSPELFQGLSTVICWLRQWFRPDSRLLVLDAEALDAPSRRDDGGRAGCFFSGGVDSLATLRLNRRHFPRTHPGSFRDALLVCGLEVDRLSEFERVLDAVKELAADGGVSLVPVYSNIRLLDENWAFYRDEWQGAILAAIGHACAGRLAALSLAATYDIPNLAPWGSHPLLDPNFSTHRMRILHDGIMLSRLEKLKLLLDWPTALRRMRVCNKTELYRPGMLNCGRCEKCVRTMLGLLALQALDRAPAFPSADVSEDTAAAVRIHDPYVASCYGDLLAPLAAQGRDDLVRGIQESLRRYRNGGGYKALLRRLDGRYLHGSLRALKHAVTPGRLQRIQPGAQSGR